MTESQKQFEEWYSKEGLNIDPLRLKKYACWQAWQASRAAIAVKLPAPEFCAWVSHETIEGYKAAVDEVKYSLDVAGVSYE